ncbi:hypothetical protein D3C85_1260690 [compost metagenome]
MRLALIGHQPQETELDHVLVVRGHESTLALPARHQVLGGQFVDGLAHRALADLVARGQVHFARDHFARFPFAGLQALGNQGLDLLVERAERGRGIGRAGGRRIGGGRLRPGTALRGARFRRAVAGCGGQGRGQG